jgi:hypothetical protein
MYARDRQRGHAPALHARRRAAFVRSPARAARRLNVENLLDARYFATSHGNNNIMPGARARWRGDAGDAGCRERRPAPAGRGVSPRAGRPAEGALAGRPRPFGAAARRARGRRPARLPHPQHVHPASGPVRRRR